VLRGYPSRGPRGEGDKVAGVKHIPRLVQGSFNMKRVGKVTLHPTVGG